VFVSSLQDGGRKPEIQLTIVTYTNVVPKPKWRYQARRIHITSHDSWRYRFLPNIKMAERTGSSNELESFSNNNVIPNQKMARYQDNNI